MMEETIPRTVKNVPLVRHGVFDRRYLPTQLGYIRFNSGEALFDILGPLVNAAQGIFPGCVFGSGHDEYYT